MHYKYFSLGVILPHSDSSLILWIYFPLNLVPPRCLPSLSFIGSTRRINIQVPDANCGHFISTQLRCPAGLRREWDLMWGRCRSGKRASHSHLALFLSPHTGVAVCSGGAAPEPSACSPTSSALLRCRFRARPPPLRAVCLAASPTGEGAPWHFPPHFSLRGHYWNTEWAQMQVFTMGWTRCSIQSEYLNDPFGLWQLKHIFFVWILDMNWSVK